MATSGKFTTLFNADFFSNKYTTFRMKINSVANGQKLTKFIQISKASRAWNNGEMSTTWSNVSIPLAGWSGFAAAVATVTMQLAEPVAKGITIIPFPL